MFRRSPRAAGPASFALCFSTGSLSPVSDASATRRLAAWTRRPSAPTASPSPSTSRSPGTSSSAGIRLTLPSRTTLAVLAAIRCSAATACSAFASCTKPRTALAITITTITSESTGAPWRPSTIQATSDTATATSSR